MAKKVQVRVLVDTPVGRKTYKANQVVEFDDKLAKQLETAGFVDSTKESVAYCIEGEGAEVIKHVDDEPADGESDAGGEGAEGDKQ